MTWSETMRTQLDEDLALVDALALAGRVDQLRELAVRVAARAHTALDVYDAATAPRVGRSAPNRCPECRHNRWHDERRGCLDFNPPAEPEPRSRQCGCKARSDGLAP